jgi:DNA modification methylase
MKIDADRLNIVNPKRDQRRCHDRQSWYSFYASFSLQFAEALISSVQLPPGALIVDPWNGTGTSSLAAASLGHLVRGFDLNPVMVVAARA